MIDGLAGALSRIADIKSHFLSSGVGGPVTVAPHEISGDPPRHLQTVWARRCSRELRDQSRGLQPTTASLTPHLPSTASIRRWSKQLSRLRAGSIRVRYRGRSPGADAVDALDIGRVRALRDCVRSGSEHRRRGAVSERAARSLWRKRAVGVGGLQCGAGQRCEAWRGAHRTARRRVTFKRCFPTATPTGRRSSSFVSGMIPEMN